MKNLIFFFLIILVNLAPTDLEAKTYTLGLIPWGGLGIHIVAAEEGFFEKENIDINVRIFSILPDWKRALTSGTIDIVVCYTTTHLTWYNSDIKMLNIGSVVYDMGDTNLIKRKGMSPLDVYNGKIGMGADIGCFRWIVSEYLLQNGIEAKKLDIAAISTDDCVKNFTYGRIQCVITNGDYTSQVLKDPTAEIAFSSKDNHDGLTLINAMPVHKFKAMPEEDLRKYWRATINALRWIQKPENHSKFQKILSKHFVGNHDLIGVGTSESFKKAQLRYKYLKPEKLRKHNDFSLTLKKLMKHRAILGIPGDMELKELINTKALLQVLDENGL